MKSARRRAAWGALLLAAVTAVAVLGNRSADRTLRLAEVKRSTPHPGAELLEARVLAGRAFRGRLVALFLEPEAFEFDLVLNPARVSLAALAGPDTWVVVNAGYFTSQNKPTGLLASHGRVLHRFVREAGSAGSGVLVVDEEIRLVERDRLALEDFEAAQVAIQAGPRIIENDGTPGIRSDDGMRANRTVWGRDGRGRLVLAVVYAPEAGVGVSPTLFEIQSLLGAGGLGRIDPALALVAALNLDGGPSTGLYVRAPDLRLPALNRVASALRVRRK